MENNVVRRRVNVIASHLGSHEDISATATHLFPMSCSNSLNSIIQRRDSRLQFARQSSSSQGYFMRPASNELEIGTQSSIPSKSTTCANEDTYAYNAPMFSKPAARQDHKLDYAPMFSKPAAREEHKLHNVGKIQRSPQACNYHQPNPDFPTFGRPGMSGPHYHVEPRKQASKSNGFEWLPKMDVGESGSNYLVALELPGVNIGDVRVEVNNQNLRVTGNRSAVWLKTSNYSTTSIPAYHKREITEGRYQIVWPLPTNVNKDNISAEFTDGLLMITVPKLSKA